MIIQKDICDTWIFKSELNKVDKYDYTKRSYLQRPSMIMWHFELIQNSRDKFSHLHLLEFGMNISNSNLIVLCSEL